MRCARSTTSFQRAVCSGERPAGGSGSLSGGGGGRDDGVVCVATGPAGDEIVRFGGSDTRFAGSEDRYGGGDGCLGGGVAAAAGGAGEEIADFASTRAAC